MQSGHFTLRSKRQAPVSRWIFGCVLIVVVLMGTSLSRAFPASPSDLQDHLDAIAVHAGESPMLPVPEGRFIIGTARHTDRPFSLDLQYDNTEQPQRHIWLDHFEIDRDEVSLGEYLLWLRQRQQPLSDELRRLIEQVTTVQAVPPETLARWPALYVTWSEATAFCQAHGKRLPTEAEWEKAARGERGYLFPWGQSPPTPELAMFGQYHGHEIPAVAPVDTGKEGQSPYGLRHMAGNAAEWVEDWYGIDYYATMPDRNPPGPASGRYKVVRGGSWKSTPVVLRNATRIGASPDRRAATTGFRCARSVQ